MECNMERGFFYCWNLSKKSGIEGRDLIGGFVDWTVVDLEDEVFDGGEERAAEVEECDFEDLNEVEVEVLARVDEGMGLEASEVREWEDVVDFVCGWVVVCC